MDTVGRSKRQIQDYIKRQLDEDQMSRKDFIDPFTGGKNIKDIRTPLERRCFYYGLPGLIQASDLAGRLTAVICPPAYPPPG